ncbi:LAMI_0D08592g1_1 [Lachancea mirantina]|uniref:LAMI_0D08592g1_1 n=1 Tax=Lachancea mirantina TaxID=1230905 RepID=A0A1G4JD29_9SACH|nr:LAMI_0D08592g1_1 [Lachancea mirantina]
MFWSSKSSISSNYSYSSSPTFSAEPWSVHTGRPKNNAAKSSASRVSVFIFDKKQFESTLLSTGAIRSKTSAKDKKIIQSAYESLKTQVNNLMKLKHPNVLTIIEPLEEHSKNFIFVSEYVSGCVDSIFGCELTQELDFMRNAADADKIVTKRGILQICQALDFLHNRASCVLLDLQPRSILINGDSDWQIFGLGHVSKLPQGTNTGEYYANFDAQLPAFLHVPLNYSAPELILENTLSPKNDYFSLGLLIYFLYTSKHLFNCQDYAEDYRREYKKYENQLMRLTIDGIFSKVPDTLRYSLSKLMNRDIFSRFDDINELLETEFFQDPLLKTLTFLDDMPTKSDQEISVFLKGLSELLSQFPSALLQRKFMPILLNLLDRMCSTKGSVSESLGSCLDVIIKIGSGVSQLTFHEAIYPHLIAKANFPILLASATDYFIENLQILKDKTKPEPFAEEILKPLCTYTLSTLNGESAVNTQEALISKLKICLDALDYSTVKQFLFPLLSQLFMKTTSSSIKSSCIKSFELLIDEKLADKFTCTENMLPLFKSMKTRDPRILMTCLGLFRKFPTLTDDENVLVAELLPLLWDFSLAMSLRPSQYAEFTDVINKISSKVQKSHMEKVKASNGLRTAAEEASFANVIEKPVKKKEDLETLTAHSISATVMQPKPPTRARNVSREDKSLRAENPTVRPVVDKFVAPRTSEPVSKPLVLMKGVSQKNQAEPLKPTKRTNQNSLGSRPSAIRSLPAGGPKTTRKPAIVHSDDDFDEFVSSTPTPPPAPGNTTPSASPSMSFPPGFSMAIQPQARKPANSNSSLL